VDLTGRDTGQPLLPGRFSATFDNRLSSRERGDVRSRSGLPSKLRMQDGEAVGAQTEAAVLLRNAETKPPEGGGVGPQFPIERTLAVDERVHGRAAALLRQHAGDAFPQGLERCLVQ